jgi:probable rRNA maturation factor
MGADPAHHRVDPVAAGASTDTAPVTTATDQVTAASDAAVGEPDEPPSRPGVWTADERELGGPEVDMEQLARLLGDVLLAEGVPAHAEASLTLVDPEPIAQLKADHLDGDGSPTDVLSFPIDGLEGDPDAGPQGSWMVGDIVLCPSVAAAQAPEHAGSVDDELALLVVHGGLHLVGWDHASLDERRAMWSRERDLMTALYRVPARDPWLDDPGDGDDAAALDQPAPDHSHSDPGGRSAARHDPELPREGLN